MGKACGRFYGDRLERPRILRPEAAPGSNSELTIARRDFFTRFVAVPERLIVRDTEVSGKRNESKGAPGQRGLVRIEHLQQLQLIVQVGLEPQDDLLGAERTGETVIPALKLGKYGAQGRPERQGQEARSRMPQSFGIQITSDRTIVKHVPPRQYFAGNAETRDAFDRDVPVGHVQHRTLARCHPPGGALPSRQAILPDMRSFLRVTLGHVCPACLVGPLFERGFEMYEHCPACGQDLIGSDGAQYGGPMVFGYTVGGAGGVALVLLLLAFGASTELALAAGLISATATIALTWRHGKAAWTWLLYRTGQLRKDDVARAGG